MDAAGDFVIAWGSSGQDGSGYGIFAQRYDKTGAAQGTEFRVNSYTTGNQGIPEVAMDSTGDFYADHVGQQQSGWQRLWHLRTALQRGRNRSKTLNSKSTAATGHQEDPTIAMDAAGTFVIAWNSYLQDGSQWGIFAQRFNASKNRPGKRMVKVNTNAEF